VSEKGFLDFVLKAVSASAEKALPEKSGKESNLSKQTAYIVQSKTAKTNNTINLTIINETHISL